jgi:hypothetical protein
VTAWFSQIALPRWTTYSQKPFFRLARLFVQRTFRGTGDAGQDELGFGTGLLLALLSLPGGFYSILLFSKYSTFLQWMRGEQVNDLVTAALPDEYFLIVISTVVTGLVAVWQWDSLFPDRRDFANLVPLPLSALSIFGANFTAIFFLAALLALDVNAASGLLFPFVVSASGGSFLFFVHFLGIHVFVVLLASTFSFFSILLIVGLLTLVLPYAIFRRVSLYLRAIVIACLVATLATSFAVPPRLGNLTDSLVQLLPPVWFFGLYELLRGISNPLAHLGRAALIASAVAPVAAAACYASSYRRVFIRIPETVDRVPTHQTARLSWAFRLLDRTVLNTPFQQAGFRFVIKSLFRNERQGLILGGFLGLGVITAAQFLFSAIPISKVTPSAELLAIPLILSYCIILGLRFAFAVPTDIRANWIFQLCIDRTAYECVPLGRRILLASVVPWLITIVFPLYTHLWGWRVGVMEAFVVTAWSSVLVEILLLHFRSIPFTRPYPSFRDSAVVVAISYILGFFGFVMVTAYLELGALHNSSIIAVLIALPVGAWYVLSQIRRGIPDIDRELVFEQSTIRPFELLDLSKGN